MTNLLEVPGRFVTDEGPARAPYVHPPLPPGVSADNVAPVVVDDTGIFDGTERYVPILENDVSDAPYDLSTLHFVLPTREAGTMDGGVTLGVPGQGTWVIDTVVGDARFVPNEGFTGTPRPIAYQVFDDTGLPSSLAIITLEDQHPPILNADGTTYVGDVVELDVLANDVASDGIDAGSLKLAGSDGTLGDTVDTADGNWVVTDAGAVRFTPAEGFTGQPTEVGYTAADPLGNFAEPLPLMLADAAAPVLEAAGGDFTGAATRVSAYGADAHGELRPASVVQFVSGDAANNPLETIDVAGEGSWTSAADEVVFSPLAGFTDAPTPQQVRVLDAAGNASNDVDVTLADLAPPAVMDDAFVSNEGGTIRIDVVANDGLNPQRFADSLAFVCAPQGAIIAANGQSMEVAGAGQWTVADGALHFSPEEGYLGGIDLVARYGLADALGNAAAAELTFRYAEGAIEPPTRPLEPEPEPPITNPGEPGAPLDPADAASLVPVIILLLEEE